jgi:ribosomal protein S18 acetylase RimI-like enzyme
LGAIRLQDKEEIRSFFSHNVPLHLYEIGDLDEFFWPYTAWHALKDADGLKAVVLLYNETSLPVLLALAEEPAFTRELLQSLIPTLPGCFYAHLSPSLEDVFQGSRKLVSHGRHNKMALTRAALLDAVDVSGVVPLSLTDLEDLARLYAQSYPGNWFVPRMLETNQYFGIHGPLGLVSAAGIHVYSPAYKVAALGNITTHPDFRGRGLGKAVTARLCLSLLETVEHIGLNVQADNEEAIRCYRRLGFEVVGSYGEWTAA